MKSALIPADADFPSSEVERSSSVDTSSLGHSYQSVPIHPLGVKPSGNAYTASSNARHSIGVFEKFPDEMLAIFLEYLDARSLCLLGSTSKFLYAFCRIDDLWKQIFIA